MYTLLLTLHIIIATGLLASNSYVVFAGWRQQKTRVYELMMASFIATLASGTLLLFVGLGSLGRICAAMTAVTLATLAVRYYYLRRIAALTV